MPELLLELLSEEIPARMQARAAADLKRLVTDKLKDAGLDFDSAESYATPRRLALVVDGLPEKQPDVTEERKGPRVGAPEQAIQGFLKSAGLERLDQCEIREVKGNEFYFLVREKSGKPTRMLLGPLLFEAVSSLPWPKSMRWAETDFRWVRPIESMVAMFDGQALGGGFEIGQEQELGDFWGYVSTLRVGPKSRYVIPLGNSTSGHRFLAPEQFKVTDFADYKAKLRKAKVILDPAERRKIIQRKAAKCASDAGLTLKDDPSLLDEVTGLVEWPAVLMGAIDQEFMEVPPEVLTTAMRTHQKYFALESKDGALAPYFLVVANTNARKGRAAVVAGNERVLRARLADAKFFWDQDRRTKLKDRLPSLGRVIFHAKLGSLLEKMKRVESLAAEIAKHVPGADIDRVRLAARLAKADLTTEMVGEFPELQGLMGRYYALQEGEHEEVADAIAEHYAPLGPSEPCPSKPVSVAVALADKIDTLVGFFAIEERPTGSKDPYALRRAALGVIRLTLENNLRFSLSEIIHKSHNKYLDRFKDEFILKSKTASGRYKQWQLILDEPADQHADYYLDLVALHMGGGFERLTKVGEPAEQNETNYARFLPTSDVQKHLLDFFGDRLVVYLRSDGLRHDLINAVIAQRQADAEVVGDVDLVRVVKRAHALNDFLTTENGASLLEAHKRSSNIVRIEQEKDGIEYQPAGYNENLSEGDEAELWKALERVRSEISPLSDREEYVQVMTALAALRQPVDTFFDSVTVNAEAPALRENRLRLLAYIVFVMNDVADFSKIEG